MGLFDDVGKTVGKITGSIFGRPTETEQGNTLMPEQQDLLRKMVSYYRPQIGSNDQRIQSLVAGTPSTTINSDTTREYYNRSIANPANRKLYGETLPAVNRNYARNYWSTARTNAQNKAITDNAANLDTIRGNLLYQDENARRGLAESAANRSVQALQYDPTQTMLRLLGIQPVQNTVVQGASPFDVFANLGGTAATMYALGK